MSRTAVQPQGAMPYGGIPIEALLRKLEETDPEQVDAVGGHDELHDVRDEYDDFARSQLINWGPDVPFLESDGARRDPALSRSMLNLRYNGTRGSSRKLPSHPELFIGFMGNDPRGSENNPRFDLMREQIESRAKVLELRMGNNDDNHEAERPWTGQAINQAMQDVHRRMKKTLRIFKNQKMGRSTNNNTVYDVGAVGGTREERIRAGAESLGDGARFVAGDHAAANGAATDGVRGADFAHRAGAETAPWRLATNDATLTVERFGNRSGAGRAHVDAAAQGGGRLDSQTSSQQLRESAVGRSVNRHTLAATMASAARHQKAIKSGAHGHTPGRSDEASRPVNAGLAPRDVAHIYRQSAEDQARRPGVEVQDDEYFMPGASAMPSADLVKIRHDAQGTTTPNSYLTNVETIVAGLREGTASAKRRIAGSVIVDGVRGRGEAVSAARKGETPSTDYGRTARLADASMLRSAASGLEVQSYKGAAPARPERRVSHAQGAFEGGTWRASHETLPLGESVAPEWRSATQGQTSIGDDAEKVFGFDAEVHGFQGTAAMGTKRVRAGNWSDSAGLTDELVDGLN